MTHLGVSDSRKSNIDFNSKLSLLSWVLFPALKSLKEVRTCSLLQTEVCVTFITCCMMYQRKTQYTHKQITNIKTHRTPFTGLHPTKGGGLRTKNENKFKITIIYHCK